MICSYCYNLLFLLIRLSDVEEKSVVFSLEQTEALFNTPHMSTFFTAEGAGITTESGDSLFKTFKEEPDDLAQLAPTPGDTIISLDFGQFRPLALSLCWQLFLPNETFLFDCDSVFLGNPEFEESQQPAPFTPVSSSSMPPPGPSTWTSESQKPAPGATSQTPASVSGDISNRAGAFTVQQKPPPGSATPSLSSCSTVRRRKIESLIVQLNGVIRQPLVDWVYFLVYSVCVQWGQ